MPGILDQLSPPPAGKNGWPWTEETDPSIYERLNDWPKISIVTPSYNQGQFIEETIRSVLLQNYPNLEYIIIDGGSNDNSVQIIKKYEPWITYWVSEKDNGQSHAINKGLNRSNGRIFNWLNSDDFYASRTFFYIANQFKVKSFSMLCCKEVSFDENISFLSDPTKIYREKIAKTILASYLNQPCSFFNLDLLKHIGPIDESFDFLMDADIFLRLLLNFGQNEIVETNFISTYFRIHQDSKTVSKELMFHEDRKKISISIYSTIGIPSGVLEKINPEFSRVNFKKYKIPKKEASSIFMYACDEILNRYQNKLVWYHSIWLFISGVYKFPFIIFKSKFFFLRKVLFLPRLRERFISFLYIKN